MFFVDSLRMVPKKEDMGIGNRWQTGRQFGCLDRNELRLRVPSTWRWYGIAIRQTTRADYNASLRQSITIYNLYFPWFSIVFHCFPLFSIVFHCFALFSSHCAVPFGLIKISSKAQRKSAIFARRQGLQQTHRFHAQRISAAWISGVDFMMDPREKHFFT